METDVGRSRSFTALTFPTEADRYSVLAIRLSQQNSSEEDEARRCLRDSHRVLALRFERYFRRAVPFGRVAHSIDFHFGPDKRDGSVPRFLWLRLRKGERRSGRSPGKFFDRRFFARERSVSHEPRVMATNEVLKSIGKRP